ncbi:hypothetical protein Tco_1262706 [Tanacetum coccineum]
MDITRAKQIALDDALVAHANRLKIGKRNLRLSSDLKSKEATLQVMYDVLKLTPFYKAFPEAHPQSKYLGHSREIKVITDVNVNKLHQPWRSFAAVINKCMSGKSTGYDSLRLSQVSKILCGHVPIKKNVDFALPSCGRRLWFYQVVEQECQEVVMRCTTSLHQGPSSIFIMTKGFINSIRNMVKLQLQFQEMTAKFTMIKVVSRHEDTQLYGAILPDKLTNEAIKDSESYKEYYDIALGAEPPKTKASVQKKQTVNNEDCDKPRVSRDVPTYATDDEGLLISGSLMMEKDHEESDEVSHGANVEGEEPDEEATNKEDKAYELYRDVNVNLDGRDTKLTDAPRTIIQTT